MLVMDVDGTLTDGKIYMSSNGELMKAFNIKDGYALARLSQYGITPVIITGRKSKIVERRCEELNIKEVHQGVANKTYKLREICRRKKIELGQCAYIGDDLNDLPCMLLCGLKAAPADAVKQVREKADYVCESKGGEGAIREFCELILTKQSAFDEDSVFHLEELCFENDPYIGQ